MRHHWLLETRQPFKMEHLGPARGAETFGHPLPGSVSGFRLVSSGKARTEETACWVLLALKLNLYLDHFQGRTCLCFARR
jgi:hypothetical protein